MRRVLLFSLVLVGVAHAQAVDRRYAEEPTDGLALPAQSIAGEFDSRSVVLNPAGMAFMHGPELSLALDLEDDAVATSGGPGFGIYAATDLFGDVLPKIGIGLGLEWLRPPRTQLAQDPGEPFRLTVSHANAIGKHVSVGLSFHYFMGGGPLEGVDTFDLALAIHANNYFAIGANLKDLDTGDINGVPVQRRYELELFGRPLGTDRLELSVGGRIGETRGDVDGWARVGVRATRGVYVIGAVESRALHEIDESPAGVLDNDIRETRATVGFELSLGQLGIAAYGTGLRSTATGTKTLGGTFIAKVSANPPASVIPPDDHIERVELTGTLNVRAMTAIILRLRSILHDPSAKGVVVVFDGAEAGWGALQEVRQELLALRAAKKKVFSYMVSGTSRDYFVASAADKIYLDPAGGLRLVGMAGQTFYFKGAFDLVGVVPQFEKIGEYKSAPEEFTETGPTPIAARMHDELFESLWQQWLAAVSSARHLTPAELKKIIDDGPYTAGELAQNTKLVDAVAAPDKVAQLIMQELGAVMPVSVPPSTRSEQWEHPQVAVVYIDGDITDGASRSIPVVGEQLAGGESIVQALAAAREDPNIQAVILRIDSPGGSALASELIAREVFATRGVKPIICSMSNLAASGGYFAAAGCDAIFAEPMTITGSIGIFFGKFDVSGLVKKLGITIDTFKRGARADSESLFRPYTNEERIALLDKLRYSYARFVGAVADGRHMTKDAVDAVGRGHVFTGDQARPIGLVDRFGGLGDALDEARVRLHMAPNTQLDIKEFPKVPVSWLSYVEKVVSASQPEFPLSELPVFKELVRGIPASVLVQPSSAQMRLPYVIKVE
ncbi:MAG: signal peptide peptidase SppA [Kofleriaceae bacterium]